MTKLTATFNSHMLQRMTSHTFMLFFLKDPPPPEIYPLPLPDALPIWGENMYRDEAGNRRPLARMGDRIVLWYDDFDHMEEVVGFGGPRAEDSLEAVQLAAETHDLRSEEHTSELQSHLNLVCPLLLEKK